MLVNRTTKKVLARNIEEAKKYRHRLKGLIGRKTIEENYALIIYACSGVHTYFMRFPIDILLLDKDKKVIQIYKNMVPWKKTKIIKGAIYVVEMKGNSLPVEVQVDHVLDWSGRN